MNEHERTRRIGGWGYQDQDFEPSRQLMAWLHERVGGAGPGIPDTSITPPAIKARSLPKLRCPISTDAMDRLAHARGQGLVDIIRIRTNLIPALPDAVLRPSSADEIEGVLRQCSREGVRVIPWGGGTSVTGGVNIIPDSAPSVSLDLGEMSDLENLDAYSGLATFGPGANGPQVEAALTEHDLTLGHYPQSWELATVGGWVAARSSGQESLGYGRIEDMVAGLDIIAPAGRIRIPSFPASAAGPDLRQFVLGSEGRFGVITSVTLRVRPRPKINQVEAALLPNLENGLKAARHLVNSSLPLTLLRLSDAPETQVAMAVGLGSSVAAPLVRGYLRIRGIGPSSCLMLVGAAGERDEVRTTLGQAASILRSYGAVILGQKPGRHWQRDRFRHPYLREALLDRGYATDTLETAVPWSQALATRESVGHAIASALEDEDRRVAVLCHASHPYPDGVSLYFTFFFATDGDPERCIHLWAKVKRVANTALLKAKATLSHHHGIGQWHAPCLEEEIGPLGLEMLKNTAALLDPKGILNPHALLDGTDRLEV